MAARECVQCGLPFVGQRSTARYCSSKCRVNATRARARGLGEPKSATPPAARQRTPQLVLITRKTLRDAGVLKTVAGARAILLAERASNPRETGNAVAALAKQCQEAVDVALASVSRGDQMDEVTRRRDVKLREARGA